MRESQSVAFRLSLTLEASYKSHADEDGLEDWAVAPKNPPDILTYDEVYVKRKLEPPTDPESVIIDRPHSFPPEIPAQLLPPHPMHPHSSSSEQVATQEHAQQLNTISIRLYTPATCSEATGLSSSSCKSVHQQLFRTTRKAVSIDGIYFFDIQTEAMSLEGLDDPSQQKKEQEHRRPVLFFLHGGGLVGLSTASYDKLIRRMTNLLGAADGIVISIDYRQESLLTKHNKGCF
ncbi:alpha/beta hydrolase fold domain containing protein, putative [Eimeria maxima]|uniref:Alpha/beta hydrolase fold domain containing protein, putative n=1 Tax=Eimeria maxima TaxID=5804 RepID=U6M968_EIMMA|nr:alpha/beta hydrolase fold domain containing protein, putative [Eimeria maxima]CDJ60772.1 alpha/beta hydrolase fold domain containing protein, putative [Eimeria maxima]